MAEPVLWRAYTLAAEVQLGAELRRWAALGMRPAMWWRDDDVRAPSEALDRLIAAAAGRPLALAVIPGSQLGALVARLATEGNITVGQHGVDHLNQRPVGVRPSEYPTPPSVEALVERIGHGRRQFHRVGLIPLFYSPPWNAIDLGLGQALVRLGVPVWSGGAHMPEQSGPAYLSTELDILRWKGAPRFKGIWRLLSSLRRALEERRKSGYFRRPIGLLTHHLDHDEAAWRFLDWLTPYLDQRADWVSVAAATGLPGTEGEGAVNVPAMALAGRV